MINCLAIHFKGYSFYTIQKQRGVINWSKGLVAVIRNRTQLAAYDLPASLPTPPTPQIPLYWVGLGQMDSPRTKSMQKECHRHGWDPSLCVHVPAIDGRGGIDALRPILEPINVTSSDPGAEVVQSGSITFHDASYHVFLYHTQLSHQVPYHTIPPVISTISLYIL